MRNAIEAMVQVIDGVEMVDLRRIDEEAYSLVPKQEVLAMLGDSNWEEVTDEQGLWDNVTVWQDETATLQVSDICGLWLSIDVIEAEVA